MSRSRFRSQPTLERSGGGRGFGALGLGAVGLALALAVGAYSLSRLGEPAPAPLVEAQPVADLDLQSPFADRAPPVVVSTPAPVATPAPVPVVQQARAAPAQRGGKRRQVGPQYPLAASAEDAGAAASTREREQRDYQAALARYEAAEHDEGYRWAKTNRVRTARYCRSTGRRTEAFMQGCLAFVGRVAERPNASPSRSEAAGDEG